MLAQVLKKYKSFSLREGLLFAPRRYQYNNHVDGDGSRVAERVVRRFVAAAGRKGWRSDDIQLVDSFKSEFGADRSEG